MFSRRSFFRTAAGGSALMASGSVSASTYSGPDVDAKLARRDFRGLAKQDLPTPSLLLDQEILAKNLNTMAAHSKATGIHLRPHAKVHKCVDIAKQQLELGAVGVCCATIAECMLMVDCGIHGVLWTCQPAGRHKVERTVALARKDATFMCVVDDPLAIDALNEAAGALKTVLKVIVDLDIGLGRQGVEPGKPALCLVQQLTQCKHLVLAGLMGYSGAASHTNGWENRRKRSREDLAALLETLDLCRRSGIPIDIVTGGSTGTYNIDSEIERMTELQTGSYVVMDTVYRTIGSKHGGEVFDDFGTALSVLTTVVSRTKPKRATIDAGNKAMVRPTDEVKGVVGVKVGGAGAEYGMLSWEDSDREIKLGDRVELILSNIDMSVNAFDRMIVCRGDHVVDVYPVMGRTGPSQR